MSAATQFYLSSILILFCLNVIPVWGLDLQYGLAGIYNFAFILFQAAGAYTMAVFTVHRAGYYQAGETYVGGYGLPEPWPLLLGTIAGGLLAIPIGLIGLRRLRGDYQAMAMLVLSLIATGYVTANNGFLNGQAGIAFIPKPWQQQLNLTPLGYQWVFLLGVAALAGVAYLITRGIHRSPYGRVLRSLRDDEVASAALGRQVTRVRMQIFIVGGCFGGLSGALLAQYVGAWSPGSWQYQETFLFFTAVIVGGSGNLLGAMIGAAVVPVGLQEATRFLPQFGYPGLIDPLSWVVVGLALLAFLWFRPQGIIPERRRRLLKDRLIEPLPDVFPVAGAASSSAPDRV